MNAKLNTILGDQSGVALVIALIMMVVITLIALASSYTSIYEIKMSGSKRGATDAFYAADSGINAITAYPTNFNISNYTHVLNPNTETQYDNPFNDHTTNPTNPASAKVSIIAYLNQSGPPRGMGDSAVNLGYAYYQVQSTGNDTAGSGATTELQEDVLRLLPVQ